MESTHIKTDIFCYTIDTHTYSLPSILPVMKILVCIYLVSPNVKTGNDNYGLIKDLKPKDIFPIKDIYFLFIFINKYFLFIFYLLNLVFTTGSKRYLQKLILLFFIILGNLFQLIKLHSTFIAWFYSKMTVSHHSYFT